MKEKIYIETSIISYLISKSNRDIVITAKQELSREWWNEQKDLYQILISDLVIEEISKGDIHYSKQRMELIRELQVLEVTPKTIEIANSIIDKKILPQKATDDILHISLAISHNIDYLLTWNCKHIANPHIIKSIENVAHSLGCQMPILCTPIEILGGYNEL